MKIENGKIGHGKKRTEDRRNVKVKLEDEKQKENVNRVMKGIP